MRTTYTATTTEAKNLHSGKQTAIVTMVKPQPDENGVTFMPHAPCLDWEQIYKEEWKPFLWDTEEGESIAQHAPYAKGTRIIVREAWQTWALGWIHRSTYGDNLPNGIKWRSPVTMPCEAARTWLTVGDTVCVMVHKVLQDLPEWLEGNNAIEKGQAWYRFITAKFGQQFWNDNGWVFITNVKLK